MGLKKVQWVAFLTLILGLCMVVPGWLWMNTSAVGSLSLNQSHEFDLSPTYLSERTNSCGNWALPPNEISIVASIFAHAENATFIPPFVELYHEVIEISIEIEDLTGARSTPASTHLGIEIRNESAEFGAGTYEGFADQFLEIQLPSITRFWINVSMATRGEGDTIESNSLVFVELKWLLMYEPIEHDIALGLFFTGIAFMAESFVIFVTEFAREKK
ncbi:MAG: hypothetical protein ACFFCO_04465 [Promethearchaeota archaeon]